MKTYCVKDHLTSKIFKVLFNEQEFQEFLNKNPEISECINCIECEDAPSITLE